MHKENFLNLGLVKLDTVALEMGVPVSTLRTWKRRQDIPPVCFKKIGGTVLVIVDEFRKWVGRNEVI